MSQDRFTREKSSREDHAENGVLIILNSAGLLATAVGYKPSSPTIPSRLTRTFLAEIRTSSTLGTQPGRYYHFRLYANLRKGVDSVRTEVDLGRDSSNCVQCGESISTFENIELRIECNGVGVVHLGQGSYRFGGSPLDQRHGQRRRRRSPAAAAGWPTPPGERVRTLRIRHAAPLCSVGNLVHLVWPSEKIRLRRRPRCRSDCGRMGVCSDRIGTNRARLDCYSRVQFQSGRRDDPPAQPPRERRGAGRAAIGQSIRVPFRFYSSTRLSRDSHPTRCSETQV